MGGTQYLTSRGNGMIDKRVGRVVGVFVLSSIVSIGLVWADQCNDQLNALKFDLRYAKLAASKRVVLEQLADTAREQLGKGDSRACAETLMEARKLRNSKE